MADETESVESKVEQMFAGEVEDDTTEVVEPEYEADQEEELPDPEAPVVEGDDDPEIKAEESEESEDEGFEDVEYDGKLYSVPKELKDALLRTNDYTQKTQEVAAQRKEAEILRQQAVQAVDNFKFAESIQGDVIKAQQLETQAEQAHQYLRDNIDDLSSLDIEKIRMAIDDARKERDSIVKAVQGKQQTHQQAQQQSREELLKQGTEVLRQKIPNWGEDNQKAVRDYALNSGYTEDEIQSVLDPRMVETLWKASQYDSLQQGKAAAVRKVVATPTIKSQSRNPMPEDVKAKLNLRKQLKNPKLSSKAKARKIQEAMGDRFG